MGPFLIAQLLYFRNSPAPVEPLGATRREGEATPAAHPGARRGGPDLGLFGVGAGDYFSGSFGVTVTSANQARAAPVAINGRLTVSMSNYKIMEAINIKGNSEVNGLSRSCIVMGMFYSMYVNATRSKAVCIFK